MRTSVLVSAALLAMPAAAAQVVVTEVTYTHSGTTTTDSHLRLNPLPGTPANWVSPVDYSHGTAWVRLEVKTKPTNVGTKFQICFEATPSYACTNQSPTYTTTGVYEWQTPFPNFYQYNQVDWTKGTKKVALILKDTMNNKPSPDNVPASVAAMYMPTDLRVTVTLVSPGGTYVPPGPADGGMPMMDAGVTDAGSTVDAGVRDSGTVVVDAGEPDAGEPVEDAGTGGGAGGGGSEPEPAVGGGAPVTGAGGGSAMAATGGGSEAVGPGGDTLVGGCSSTGLGGLASLAMLLAAARRRRR